MRLRLGKELGVRIGFVLGKVRVSICTEFHKKDPILFFFHNSLK